MNAQQQSRTKSAPEIRTITIYKNATVKTTTKASIALETQNRIRELFVAKIELKSTDVTHDFDANS